MCALRPFLFKKQVLHYQVSALCAAFPWNTGDILWSVGFRQPVSPQLSQETEKCPTYILVCFAKPKETFLTLIVFTVRTSFLGTQSLRECGQGKFWSGGFGARIGISWKQKTALSTPRGEPRQASLGRRTWISPSAAGGPCAPARVSSSRDTGFCGEHTRGLQGNSGCLVFTPGMTH